MHKIIIATVAMTMAFGSVATAANKQNKSSLPGSQTKQRIGVLTCEVAGGIGLVLISRKKVECTFQQGSGKVERYTGTIGKLGIDVGITDKSYLKWVVINTKASRVGDGALAGAYIGASANASAGIGLGANVLVGGSSKNLALQPFSTETGTGLNVAAGVSRLKLGLAK